MTPNGARALSIEQAHHLQCLKPHKARRLVYNGQMPLPATLIASIVSSVIEAAAQNPASTTVNPQNYAIYLKNRSLPPEAKVGVMQPPTGDGWVVINNQRVPLSPTARFRNTQNLIVMPMSILEAKDVVFLANASGAVHRVWMLSPAEVSAISNN